LIEKRYAVECTMTYDLIPVTPATIIFAGLLLLAIFSCGVWLGETLAHRDLGARLRHLELMFTSLIHVISSIGNEQELKPPAARQLKLFDVIDGDKP
jgi:hypothetical protein